MDCYAALALYPQPQTKSKEIIIKQKPIITDLCDDILGLVQEQVLKNNTLIVFLNETERENMSADQQGRLLEYQTASEFMSQNAAFTQDMRKANLSSEQQDH